MVIVKNQPDLLGVEIAERYIEATQDKITRATIYTTLSRMVARGQITAEWSSSDGRFKTHHITPEGRMDLEASIEHYTQLIQFGAELV